VGADPELHARAGERSAPRPEEPSDDSLVRRACAGDERARGELYRRHVRYVLGLSVRLLGHRGDGEDLTQDVFATALERLGTLHDPSAFRPWVAQIAVNTIRKRIRRRSLGRLLGVEDGTPDATLERLAGSAGNGEARAELALLDTALSELPAELRIAWMLRYVEGEELESVAEICGCSLATAKRRIGRASARVTLHVEIDIEEDG
jgi:RNA polymerase sigma-70 factor (ECF subfamily)